MAKVELAVGSEIGIESAEWNDFLTHTDSANFYLRHEWGEVISSVFGHEVIRIVARSAGGVVGVLPLVRMKTRLFGHMMVSMPFLNFGGVASGCTRATLSMLEEACRIARAHGCDYLELRSRRPLDKEPVGTHKVNMALELPAGHEDLWNSFSSKHRTNIRRAYKNGVTTEFGGREFIPDFYRMMERSWRSLGTPLYSRRFFDKIFDFLGPHCRIYLARAEGQVIGAALNGHFRDTVEGIWAAGDPKARDLQANYVLYWEMLRTACDDGFKRYHLGRSTVGSGAQKFKEKWGAQAEQLYWVYDLPQGRNIPNLRPENPRYHLAMNIWKRMPLLVLRLLGPQIARQIP